MVGTRSIGILAYGSLIDDPGEEIAAAIIETISNVLTPFAVEYARSSGTRGGAPTLVPIVEGGAAVQASIFAVGVSEREAANMIWRRETRQKDSSKTYSEPPADKVGRVRVKRVAGFYGFDLVLYTSIDANISPLTPGVLADLAIASVAEAQLGKDGISYLIAAKANGIETPLSGAYESEILARTGATDLAEAREQARGR